LQEAVEAAVHMAVEAAVELAVLFITLQKLLLQVHTQL
jgi:hypothetical protein